MSPTKERSNQRILDQILERYVSYSGGNQGE